MQPRRRLIIHIGTGKTGTTAIQAFCDRNRAALAAHGLHYPRTGLFERGRAHHVLSHKWGGWLTERQLAGRDPDREWRLLREEIAALPARTRTLISSERFSAATFDPRAEGMLDYLAGLFSGIDVAILVYLRPQEELAESLYLQGVKTGSIAVPIGDYLQALPAWFDYRQLLQAWARVFGHAAIIVRRYARASWPEQDLLGDFLAAIGVPAAAGPARAGALANPSLDPVAARLIVELGLNAEPRLRPLRPLVLRHAPRGGGALIDFATRLALRTRYAESNAAVAQSYLATPDGGLFGDVAPPPPAASEDVSTRYEDLLALLRGTIEALRG